MVGFFKKKQSGYAGALTGLSFVGLVMMFWSTGQKIHYLNDPSKPLSCNINPVADCGTVINHHLSSVFNVSNSMIGMVFFSALLALGIALLLGAKSNRRLNQLITVMVAIMFGFAVWFFGVSLYIIGKICLFCAGVWLAVVPLMVLTLKEFDDDLFYGKSKRKFEAARKYINDHPYRITVVIYLLGIVLFIYRFRDYYFG